MLAEKFQGRLFRVKKWIFLDCYKNPILRSCPKGFGSKKDCRLHTQVLLFTWKIRFENWKHQKIEAANVTSPCDKRKFWKLLKNSFKNDVVQERVFTKHQPAKKYRGAKRQQPREAEERKNAQKHVYGHEIVYFDSPCAETLDVPGVCLQNSMTE